MPSRTIIDGYNLLWVLVPARPDTADALERARDFLVSKLRGKPRRPGDTIVVVFDGREGLGRGAPRREGAIEVRFSRRPGGADRMILRLVKEERDRSRLTVVTSDREVISEVKRLRARVVDSEAYAAGLRRGLDAGAEGAGGRKDVGRRTESGARKKVTRRRSSSGKDPLTQATRGSGRVANEKPAYPTADEVDRWEEIFREGSSEND